MAKNLPLIHLSFISGAGWDSRLTVNVSNHLKPKYHH